MTDQTSPLGALAQALTQMTAVQQEQAALNRQHLSQLQIQVEWQTQQLRQLTAEAAPRQAAPLAGIEVPRMTPDDDPQSYLDAFEATAAACEWPRAEWAIRLLPLLSGEAQTAALALPAGSRAQYRDVRRAVLDRTGHSREDHRRRFRSARLGPEDRPFSFSLQLRDAAARWLQPGETAGETRMLDQVVLEQFVEALPPRTNHWVRYHRPADLAAAVALAEDHLAVHPRTRSPEESPRVADRPTPAPRRRLGAPSVTGPAPVPPPRPTIERSSPRSLQGPAPTIAAPEPQGASQMPGQVCWKCGRPGHTRRDCPLMEIGQVVRVAGAPISSHDPGETYHVPVRIKGGVHQALVDSGCTQSIIHQDLVRPGALVEASWVDVRCIHGDIHRYPVVPVEIRYRGKNHRIQAAVSSRLAHPLILGTDWRGFSQLIGECGGVRARSIGLRGSGAALSGDARSTDTADGEGDPGGPSQETPRGPEVSSMEDFPLEQSRDDTLRFAFDQVIAIDGHVVRPGAVQTYPRFSIIKDRLYRVSRDTQTGEEMTQLLVPKSRREMIFQAAHFNPMAGHMGYDKTLNRIMARFYWPGIRGDVRRWCASCPECQLVNPPAIPRAPLRPLPLMQVPFERIGMDIIGPFHRSARGYRFVLVLVDYATRYPEAVPLRNISAKSVAQALFQVISRVGVPKEILTDQGTSFMSRTLRELYGLLSITSIRTSVYHPQTDGLVERLNKTLKSMVRKFMHEGDRNWDKWLDPLLFAVREVPQASSGFSPFELLFGRKPRGVLDLIKETWEDGPSPSKNEVQYVLDLRAKLHALGQLSRENLLQAQERQQRLYNRGAKLRKFSPGDKVLVLLPSSSSKLLAKWQGPFVVTRQVGDVDYEVARSDRGGSTQIYHLNLLKAWREAVPVSLVSAVSERDELGPEVPNSFKSTPLSCDDRLSLAQKAEVAELQRRFADVFSPLPGRTNLIQHQIITHPGVTVRSRPYRLPEHKRKVVQEEIKAMLEMGVIEESHSAWSSPIVLVPKKDGSVRFCVDYRRVNEVSQFDAYPMPRVDELLDRLGTARFFTTLDLTKGYWQIPLSPESKEKSAFSTPYGLYQFVTLPFGLFGAPATFQRLMDRVLRPHAAYAAAYIDDVVIHSDSWAEHVRRVAAVLESLRQAGLTANPKKCAVGRRDIRYLGFYLGGGQVRPQVDKTAAIATCPMPKSKKEVRRFLGLAGYYRRFIPNFAEVAGPLTDLTRKGASEAVRWTEQCQLAFDSIKQALCGEPLLHMPVFSLPFTLQTDASSRGLGAVLSQQVEGADRPVVYISRKLSDRETRYSTIEKECLAIRWAVDALRYYLLGRSFTLCSDHAPLQWLHRMKDANARITRWYLALQPFKFKVIHRPGSQMVVADFLSRSHEGGELARPGDSPA